MSVPTFGGARIWLRRNGYVAVGRVNDELRLGVGSNDGNHHYVLTLTDSERDELVELLTDD